MKKRNLVPFPSDTKSRWDNFINSHSNTVTNRSLFPTSVVPIGGLMATFFQCGVTIFILLWEQKFPYKLIENHHPIWASVLQSWKRKIDTHREFIHIPTPGALSNILSRSLILFDWLRLSARSIDTNRSNFLRFHSFFRYTPKIAHPNLRWFLMKSQILGINFTN